mgnify:CR=1 FL=1
MKTIFLTGATGTMGNAGMQEILRYPDKYHLRILARPSAKNKEKLAACGANIADLNVVIQTTELTIREMLLA